MEINYQRIIKSKVFKNGIWLTVLQLFNTIAPMITIPYITRILGASEYGVFSIALNLVFYVQVIVEYGFGLSGARKVALCDEPLEICKTYSSILLCRILLTGISLVFLAVFSFFGNYDSKTITCMAILFLIVIGTTIQTPWLFQGKQDMKPVTIITMSARLVSLILIFSLVKDESDLFLYCLLYASTNIISGLTGQILARKKYHVHFVKVSWSTLIAELKDGWYLFTSQAMSKIFGNIGITILGLVSTSFEVGVYSAISKITSVAILLFLPVSQALFPHISQTFASSESKALRLVKRVGTVVLLVFLGGSVIVFAFRNVVIGVAFGRDFVPYSNLLLPLLIWMLSSMLNNFLGIQTLVASGHQKEYSRSFALSMVFLVLYNFIFVNQYKMYGVAIAQMLSELTLTIFLGVSIIRSFNRKTKLS